MLGSLLLLVLPCFASGQNTQSSTTNTRGPPVTVQTSRGAVTGYRFDQGSDRSQLFYGSGDVFLGIPFAQPPVGALRFRLPRAVCSYGSGIDASAFKPGCAQAPNPFSPPSSEDCLYLNVFSPGVNNPGQRYPVLAFLHSGGFQSGETSSQGPSGVIRNYVSRGVVVVTIAYRVSMLGFFTTHTEEFPANRAIFDQLLALRWVQEEIASFGGDPSRVTLWGQSAGAVSVAALSLSPLAQGLFAQTIMQSSGIMEEWTTADSTYKSAQRAGQICGIFNITMENMAQLANCMQNARFEDLVKFDQGYFMARDVPQFTAALGEYKVSQDGVLLPDTPSRLARSRPNRPTILGNTKDEMSFFFATRVAPDDTATAQASFAAYNASFITPYLIAQRPFLAPHADVVNQILMKQYAPGNTYAPGNGLEAFKAALQAIGDALFVQNTRQDANWQLDNGNPNVFLYRYDYDGSLCGARSFQGYKPVEHGAEMCFLFPEASTIQPLVSAGTTDIAITDYLADAWSNFAASGRPSPEWAPVSSRDTMEFMKINTTRSMAENFQQISDSIYNVAIASIAGGEYPQESIRSQAWLQWINGRYAPAISAEWNANSRCQTQG